MQSKIARYMYVCTDSIHRSWERKERSRKKQSKAKFQISSQVHRASHLLINERSRTSIDIKSPKANSSKRMCEFDECAQPTTEASIKNAPI